MNKNQGLREETSELHWREAFLLPTHKQCWEMEILRAKVPSSIQEKSLLKTPRSLHSSLLLLSACSKHGNKAKKGDSQAIPRALQIEAN